MLGPRSEPSAAFSAPTRPSRRSRTRQETIYWTRTAEGRSDDDHVTANVGDLERAKRFTSERSRRSATRCRWSQTPLDPRSAPARPPGGRRLPPHERDRPLLVDGRRVRRVAFRRVEHVRLVAADRHPAASPLAHPAAVERLRPKHGRLPAVVEARWVSNPVAATDRRLRLE